MALSELTMPEWSEHLGAYKSACEIHPNLKSFDSKLQQRTNKAIDSLTAEAEKRTNIVKDLLTAKAEKRSDKETVEAQTRSLLSQHVVHKELSSHFHEVFQGVADIIVESKDNVWENKTLKSLVEAYLESTRETITILDEIEKCVEKADDGQRFIQQAVAQFDKESKEIDAGGNKNKYEKTLDKLKKFKDIGDPFSVLELQTHFELVKKQQDSLLKKVKEAIEKIHEEIDHLNHAIVIANAVCGAAAAVAAVASIALMATGVGAPLGIAVALSLPFIAMGWAATHDAFSKRIDRLKRQEEALMELKKKYESLEAPLDFQKIAMEGIPQYVDRLENKILYILRLVDGIPKEDETDIRYDLNTIRENVQKLTEGIKEVGEAVSRARKLIDKARKYVIVNLKDFA